MDKDDPFSEERSVLRISVFFLVISLALLFYDMMTDRLPVLALAVVCFVIIISGYVLIMTRDSMDPNGKRAMIKSGFLVKFVKRAFLPPEMYEKKYGKAPKSK